MVLPRHRRCSYTVTLLVVFLTMDELAAAVEGWISAELEQNRCRRRNLLHLCYPVATLLVSLVCVITPSVVTGCIVARDDQVAPTPMLSSPVASSSRKCFVTFIISLHRMHFFFLLQ